MGTTAALEMAVPHSQSGPPGARRVGAPAVGFSVSHPLQPQPWFTGRRLVSRGVVQSALLGAPLVKRLRSRVRPRAPPRWYTIALAQPGLTKDNDGKEDDGADLIMNKAAAQDLKRVVRESVAKTVFKVAFWTGLAMVLSYNLFPWLQHGAWALLVGSNGPCVLCDSTQAYLGNFLALASLLFSILAGDSYTALYSQNEAIFTALFAEVSEAKALLEQISLVCSGRPFYRSALQNIRRYVECDLRRLDQPPAVLVACKPRDDPLESILYLTSVGVPSAVYETVRSLRQKRGDRLGAVQRKLPPVQIALLYVLGGLNLLSFLLLGVQGEGRLCRALFALLTGAVVMVMRVIHELWTPIGGAYNVDGVLAVMIQGLEDEVRERLQGRTFSDTRLPPPPPRWTPPEPTAG